MRTLAAEKELIRIQTHAEKIANDAAHEIVTASPGDMWPQGDIGLVCLNAVPEGCHLDSKPLAQLAHGTTQSSRHCIVDMTVVRIYRLDNPTPLDGPIIEAPEGCTVTHPEHGDITLPPGIWGVIYQRKYADDLRRVQD